MGQGTVSACDYEANHDIPLKSCPKHPGHADFIPVKDFTLEHLPPEYRNSSVFESITNLAGLTCRLLVYSTSKNRPDVCPKTGELYPFSSRDAANADTSAARAGSGYVSRVSIKTDPIRYSWYSNENYVAGLQPWAEVVITTARHVVFDATEAKNTCVELFFDEDDKRDRSLKRLRGIGSKSIGDVEMDLAWVFCITYDLDLAHRLQSLLQDGSELRRKLTGIHELQTSNEMPKAIQGGEVSFGTKDVLRHARLGNSFEGVGVAAETKKCGSCSDWFKYRNGYRAASAFEGQNVSMTVSKTKRERDVDEESNRRKIIKTGIEPMESKLVVAKFQDQSLGFVERPFNPFRSDFETETIPGLRNCRRACFYGPGIKYGFDPNHAEGVAKPDGFFGSNWNLVVIVSHPHGVGKRITMGQMCDRESLRSMGSTSLSRITYNVPTCPGSSGAPVWHFLYSPVRHVHSRSLANGQSQSSIGLDIIYRPSGKASLLELPEAPRLDAGEGVSPERRTRPDLVESSLLVVK